MGTDSRKRLHAALAIVLAFGMLAAAPSASADGRVALVVGNGDYAAIGRLPNPGNDAADVAAALGRLGFDVTTVRDADRLAMSEALRTFTRESVGADVALVFYAGHGLEMDGVNYLVPVDARLERDTDVRFEAVDLDDVLAATAGAGLRVVILDACRNNPLARSMQRTSTTRSVSRGSFGALNEDLIGDETLVAYAAAAGTTAADGTGRNSPYTAALLEHLERPLEIGLLFREVRGQVLESTAGRQRPHEYASLLDEHYLGGAPGPGPVNVAGNASAGVGAQQETVFWQSVSTSDNPADLRAYLNRFPSGVFATLARNRLTELLAVDVTQLDAARLRLLAEGEDARAQIELARRHENGRNGVQQNNAEVVRWYRRAAEQGNARGQNTLGVMYLNGRRGLRQNDAEAIRWFRRAAEQEDPQGQANLGFVYENGRGIQRDYAKAARWYQQAAEQGNRQGQYSLGVMHGNGRGVQRDYAEAARWYRQAAEQGHAGGQYNLGVLYANGRGVQRNDADAVRWFRRAADQGHASAQGALGTLYDSGRGVQQDKAEAVRWYRRSAEQGNAIAQFNLGLQYERGEGVRRSDEEAVRWYVLAARQGHAGAQNNLGIMYDNGRGVRRNDEEAVRLYRRSAEQGNRAAQFNLGLSYEEGDGVRRDRLEAARWYRLAAEQGHEGARRRLDGLR